MGITPTIPRGELIKAAALSTIGFTLETYDLLVAATVAGLVFTRVFFPSGGDPALLTLYSFAVTILVPYLFRPLGAIIFGHIGDRLGRKVGMIWDLILTGIGTAIVAFAPDYKTAGYLGLIVLLTGRVLVGIGFGGEWGAVLALMSEQAQAAGSRWRAFWVALPYLGVPFTLILMGSILSLLSAMYPGEMFYIFGWRVAFYIGALAAVVGIVLRWILLESVAFQELRRRGEVAKAPVVEVFKYSWKPVVGVMFIYGLTVVTYYIWTAYAPVYATAIGFARDLVLQSITISGIFTIFIVILFAILSDILGRRNATLITSILAILVGIAYPLMILTKQPLLLMLAQLFIGAASLGNGAIIQAFNAEQFPTRYRYTGSGLGMQLGGAAGGVITTILPGLVGTAYTANWWVISAVVAGMAVLSAMATMLLMKETRGAS